MLNRINFVLAEGAGRAKNRPGYLLIMRVFEVITLTLGLTVDVFGVSVAVGLAMPESTLRQRVRLGWHFAWFHFLMPVLGWMLGLTVARLVAQFDHWVAFGLLSFVGGHMLLEARAGSVTFSKDPTSGATMVMLCIATSIDAFALGLSLALLDVEIWHVSAILGLAAAVMTFVGLNAGARVGERFQGWACVVGGIAIIAVGVKIILEAALSAA